ncbi:lysozyme inhibitor LprI family protein [Roseinatronobacter sp.]|uniref:lysozyme inhibitor LprI family protein n=1 Tax=Roseinatronobacter sp. TaxID=1945755 RepID=UPI0025F2F6DA|nr:lysozyme inhibitor LprI family protein [Rhodobaca sp.]
MRLTIALALCLATPAMGEDLRFHATPTESCLAESADQARECIGRAATACMGQPGGDTTIGMGFCLDAELGFWDDKLNAAYQRLRADMTAQDKARTDPAILLADSLRDMQRAWIGYRDARCGFETAQWHGGTGASPAFLGCALQVTAEQTLYLQSLLQDQR